MERGRDVRGLAGAGQHTRRARVSLSYLPYTCYTISDTYYSNQNGMHSATGWPLAHVCIIYSTCNFKYQVCLLYYESLNIMVVTILNFKIDFGKCEYSYLLFHGYKVV